MATPWDILTTPELLATVRAWALTSIPPYPATTEELRAAAQLVANVVPDAWIVTPLPDGFRLLTASCSVSFLSLFGLESDVPVYGLALLAEEDQVFVDYFPPGYFIGPNFPKLTWPVQLQIVDGRDA